MVSTERLTSIMEEKFDSVKNDIGLGRLAEPKDVANLCVFLASDDSTYITGQIMAIDGSLKI